MSNYPKGFTSHLPKGRVAQMQYIDEFLQKFQTAFDPLPIWNIILHIFKALFLGPKSVTFPLPPPWDFF